MVKTSDYKCQVFLVYIFMEMNKMSTEKFKINGNIKGIAISGMYIEGQIVSILKNTIVVSNGIKTELVRKKDLQNFVENGSLV